MRRILGVGLLMLTASSLFADEEASWKTKAPISIDYLTHRDYSSSMSVAEKLGDFDGYSSYAVKYDSDGLALMAVMNVPSSNMPTDGFPILIMNHGNAGNDWSGFSKYYSADQDSEGYRSLVARTPITRYATEGFVVFFPDYRGHGLSENHGQIDGHWQLDRHGNKAINKTGENVPRVLDNDGLRFNGWLYTAYYTIDVLNLIAALADFDNFPRGNDVDLSNLFLWGRSLGGDVTARALTCSDKIKAASLWVPATTSLWDQAHHYHFDSPLYADGISMENLFVELQTYNSNNDAPIVTRDLMPNNYTDQVEVPVMIQVSIDDAGVRSAWGIQYHYQLQEYDVATELRIYPGEDHVFKGEILEKAIQADLEFFRSQM